MRIRFFFYQFELHLIDYIQIVLQSMLEDINSQYFCFFTISSQTQLIIDSVLLSLSLLLIFDAFRKYLKMGASHNANVKFVYRMIFAWWLTYTASNVFGILLYTVHNNNPEEYQDDYMSSTSKYLFVITWANAFIIQWILIYVPYHWAKKITDLFCYLNDKGSEIEQAQKSPYKGYQTKIYPILRYYMGLRLLFIAMPILFLSLTSLYAHQVIFKLMVISLLVDCIVIITSLLFGMVSLKTTQQLKIQLDQIQSKRMVNQYLMIIIASVLRFGFDITYVISKVFGDQSFSSICPDLNSVQSISEIAYIICECIFTHYLPIFIILRIYNLQEKPEQVAKSLLYTIQSDRTFD